jgi:hypothetical protein
VNKKAATSELLDWIKALHLYGLFKTDTPLQDLKDEEKRLLNITMYTLFKSQKDYENFTKAQAVKQ